MKYYRISDLKLPALSGEEELAAAAAKKLKVRRVDVAELIIRRKSLDARKKPDIFEVYTVDAALSKGAKPKGKAQAATREEYIFPKSGSERLKDRPVVVGFGPAGMFAAYLLARCGYRPLVLERGADAEERSRAVEEFWRGGKLDVLTNVQFGEGGAGTFSDGKLYTSVKDPMLRGAFIRETFREHGAAEDVVYAQRPHIGTDVLKKIVVSMRKSIIELGGEVRFLSRVSDITVEGGSLKEIEVNGNERIAAEALILAAGHSARDTFKMLLERQVPMTAKAFAVGVRIEHPQEMIDFAQYGKKRGGLPAAAYKLTAAAPSGRGVYTFCMCPGGYVVNASSEEGGSCTNGMSYSDRGSANANSAVLVTVTPEYCAKAAGLEKPDVLSGAAFQRMLEERAFAAGKGGIVQQLYSDFVQGVPSTGSGGFASCLRGQGRFGDARGVLPADVAEDIAFGIGIFSRKIKGFDRPDSIISAVESRSSSPVRIERGEALMSSVAGLYPCGEGAGYAGGIMSAAMDGLRCAEALISKYAPVD